MRNQSRHVSPHSLFLRAFCVGLFPILLLLFASCRTQKQVQYIQGPFDTATLSQIHIPEPVIQIGDLIGITVYSDNVQASAAFNQQTSAPASTESLLTGAAANGLIGGSGQNMPGYLVNATGNINFQSIGAIHVQGLTKEQLSQMLTEKLTQYLKNPYCNIRFLNYKFTIMGEVTRQGVYTIPGERISILEALGMAGDITLYGLKDSVFVIRETNGIRKFANLNVGSPDILKSPFYFLQQNDVIIVRANPKKPTVSEQTATRNLAIVATISSIITSLAVVFNIFR